MSKLIIILVVFCFSCTYATKNETAEQGVVFETSFETSKKYDNPFADVEVRVIFNNNGNHWTVPAFWAGGNKWTVRFAPPVVGKYGYRVECSDESNTDLNGKEHSLKVVTYKGNNPLIKHGPLKISDNKQHFEYSDGTPFFWLGDTWWKGLSKRISFDGFKHLVNDRKTKGFSVVQIIAGSYPDEPAFDIRWENEGGMPYEENYECVNPAYFDHVDRRIECLVDAGIVPAIVGGWGWHMPSTGTEKMKKHWQYLVARYGAYPVIWIVGGEAGGPEWASVAEYLRSIDPYHRLMTVHPYPGSGRRHIANDAVIDFDMIQAGHGGFYGTNAAYGVWQATAANTVSKLMSSYSKTPTMPVVIGEVTYEGHMMTNGSEVQRQVFWSSVLAGSAGHTYGAGGIWQMNSDSERGAEYEYTPWFEAMHLPGSAQLGIGKKFLEEYPWQQFEPHPEWVEPHAVAMYEPHEEWYDDSREFELRGGRWDLPYAAGIPGEVRMIYIPGHYYDWSTPTVKGLECDVPYHTFLFNPASGKRYGVGVLVYTKTPETFKGKSYATKYPSPVMHENPHVIPAIEIPEIIILSQDEYKLPRLPAPQDWVLVLEKVKL